MHTGAALSTMGRLAARRATGVVLIGASALPTLAQQLPFRVPIVTWDSAALAVQESTYAAEASQHEALFCVEEWVPGSPVAGATHYVVRRVRRATTGAAHRIDDVGSLCRTADGRSLPMVHTHSDGNCQFSPADLVTVAVRQAPFDGVQCGSRYFNWQVAWQVQAIANEAERRRWQSARRPRPR